MRKGVAALIVLLALPNLGQSPKKPWMYTIEERIALRTDPRLARERVAAADRLQPRSESRDPAARPWVDDIDGKTHPELFLPNQVFGNLVEVAFVSNPRTREAVQRGFASEIARHGLPADFWQRLETISTVYISDSTAIWKILAGMRRQEGAAHARSQAQLDLKNLDACRSRVDALAAARREFGQDLFDRFLYEVIAVGMFSVTDRLYDAEVLSRSERGCR